MTKLFRRPIFTKTILRPRYKETPIKPFVHPYHLKEINVIHFEHCPIFGSRYYTRKITIKIQ